MRPAKGRGARRRDGIAGLGYTGAMLRNVLTVGGWTMASRVLGFARDMLIAAMLGAGPVADAFFVALKLPNLFRRLFGEGAFNAAFVPAFSGLLAAEGRPSAHRFAEETFAVMAFWLGGLTILGEVFMPQMMAVLAPGFEAIPAKFDLAVALSRITFPYLLLICLAALVSGVLNGLDRFTAASASYLLFNVISIACMLWLTPYVPTAGHALSWGVSVAGVAQLGLLLWAMQRAGMGLRLPRPRLTPQVRLLLRRMLPGLVGAGVTQLNLAVDVIIASLLPPGTVSLLYYADRVQQLPLGVIGTAVGTALLPLLSRQVRAGEGEASIGTLNRAIEYALFLTLPAAVALIVSALPVMSVLFGRGAFAAESVRLSAQSLDGVCAGAAGLRAGEGGGAGVLRPRRHGNAGADRRGGGGAEPGDERRVQPRLHRVELRHHRPGAVCGLAAGPGAYRPGAGDQPGGDIQCRLPRGGVGAAWAPPPGRSTAAALGADAGGGRRNGAGAGCHAARAVRHAAARGGADWRAGGAGGGRTGRLWRGSPGVWRRRLGRATPDADAATGPASERRRRGRHGATPVGVHGSGV